MFSELRDQLKETHLAHQKASRVHRHLQQLTVQLEEAYSNLENLRRNLEKEFKDVEDLEKMSLKGLFHKVLGSKEEQMEIERQEYLQASLKYDEANKSVKMLEYERNILKNQVMDLTRLDQTLKDLIGRREKELIDGATEQGRQLLEVTKQIESQELRIGDIKEVKRTGQEALMMLQKMVNYLQQAKNWGHWDMAGRNRGAGYMKHSVIDKARDLSYHVKHFLMRFKEDLRHLTGDHSHDFSIHFESFSRFTDIFFDNLISDWVVQKKIQSALDNVQAVGDRVLRINQSLEYEIEQCELNIVSLSEQRKKIVIEG